VISANAGFAGETTANVAARARAMPDLSALGRVRRSMNEPPVVEHANTIKTDDRISVP